MVSTTSSTLSARPSLDSAVTQIAVLVAFEFDAMADRIGPIRSDPHSNKSRSNLPRGEMKKAENCRATFDYSR